MGRPGGSPRRRPRRSPGPSAGRRRGVSARAIGCASGLPRSTRSMTSKAGAAGDHDLAGWPRHAPGPRLNPLAYHDVAGPVSAHRASPEGTAQVASPRGGSGIAEVPVDQITAYGCACRAQGHATDPVEARRVARPREDADDAYRALELHRTRYGRSRRPARDDMYGPAVSRHWRHPAGPRPGPGVSRSLRFPALVAAADVALDLSADLPGLIKSARDSGSAVPPECVKPDPSPMNVRYR
jgi:hypothetical protein